MVIKAKPPLVSVIVPVYNQVQYVIDSLESICAQDYPNLEILICDDCSKDETAGVIEKFLADYRGKHILKFQRNKVNKGITQNVNFLIEMAAGKYICFFAGDDLMFEEKIATQVEYMEAHPECFISYHDVEVFDSVKRKHLYNYSERHVPRSGGYDTLIRYQSFNCGCANMTRALPKVYGDNAIRYASDWLHYIDMLHISRGEIHYIDRVLGGYRRHLTNITKTDYASAYREVMKIFDLLVERYPQDQQLIDRVRSERMMTYGIKLILEKKIHQGISVFLKGFSQNPITVLSFLNNLLKYAFLKK